MKQISLPIVVEPSDCCEFLVSTCNEEAYKLLIEQYTFTHRITLLGPQMSGKTRLAKLWCGDGFYINCENDELNFRAINHYNCLVIDNFNLANETELFHTLNRCNDRGIDVLLVSSEKHNFKLPDLISRVNASFPLQIFAPDVNFCTLVVQELCIMNSIKLKNTTLDYIKYNIRFDNFADLWRFRMQLKIACDENRMVLDINIFKVVYDNWCRV